MGKRLIDANALMTLFNERYDVAFVQERTRENKEHWNGLCMGVNWGRNTIAEQPTVDAVEYDVLRKWLHEIAINNVNVPVTMDVACEIIVERLDGLRMYARENGERRTDGNL